MRDEQLTREYGRHGGLGDQRGRAVWTWREGPPWTTTTWSSSAPASPEDRFIPGLAERANTTATQSRPP